jgi:hypothetical protein
MDRKRLIGSHIYPEEKYIMKVNQNSQASVYFSVFIMILIQDEIFIRVCGS